MSQKFLLVDILSSTNRIEAPFIGVTIGGYTFGVTGGSSFIDDNRLIYKNTQYIPNFVQSLSINKINGTVNMYTLSIVYPVTEDSDPNFFEKLFSSVAKTRIINITYGDATLPNYIYRDEEAIITDVSSSIDVQCSTITYTVKATSSSSLTLSGSYSFPTIKGKSPSEVIKSILYEQDYKYHLLDVFTGMRDKELVNKMGLLNCDDTSNVTIPTLNNVSILDYLGTLSDCMVPRGEGYTGIKSAVYVLTTMEDTEGIYGGPYFKITKVAKGNTENLVSLCTHEIDIGYPNSYIIDSFRLTDNGGWSIYYDYAQGNNNDTEVSRIDSNGLEIKTYSPGLTGTSYEYMQTDRTWWTKVTGFTNLAEIKIKGLLKPALLMTHLKVNVIFFGKYHVSSGVYIITSQDDTIDTSGYWTTLGLTKVSSADYYNNIDIDPTGVDTNTNKRR